MVAKPHSSLFQLYVFCICDLFGFMTSPCNIFRITSPCNIYRPYTTFLYSETGVCRGIPIFLIFSPKHTYTKLLTVDCGYSLEPPRRSGSNVHSQSTKDPISRVLESSYLLREKNDNTFLMKIFISFTTEEKSVYCMGMFSANDFM